MTSDPTTPVQDPPTQRPRGRVQARVALALLEAMRDHDRPGEVLDDENVSETLPRRLGLSGVVLSQILRYEQETRRGRRVPFAEVADLIRLVIRRPDSDEIFEAVGRSLTAADGAPGWRGIFPARMSHALARRRVRRRLRALFGRKVVRVVGVPFELEGLDRMLLEADPGGGACGLITGLSQAVLEAYGCDPAKVLHVECRGRGRDRCVWLVEETSRGAEADPPLTG